MRIFPRPPEGEAPPEFGIDANAIQMRTIDLTVARVTPERFEIAGSVLWAITATTQAALLNIALNDQQRAFMPFQAGTFIRGVRYSRFYVTNVAQPGQTVTLLYAAEGPGNIQIENPAAQFAVVALDAATIAALIAGLNPVDLTAATIAALLARATDFISLPDLVLVGAAAAVVVLPVNAARRAVLIGSINANTAEIRIGDLAGVGGAEGLQLMPGDSLTLYTEQEVAGFVPGVANQTLTRVWTED